MRLLEPTAGPPYDGPQYSSTELDCRPQSGAEERGFAVTWDASRRNVSRRPRTLLRLPTCLAVMPVWDSSGEYPSSTKRPTDDLRLHVGYREKRTKKCAQ